MANFQTGQNIQRLINSVKNLTRQAEQLGVDITKLVNYFDGLTAPQKQELLDIAVNNGYDQAELQTFYQQLKSIRDQINTLLVIKNVDPTF